MYVALKGHVNAQKTTYYFVSIFAFEIVYLIVFSSAILNEKVQFVPLTKHVWYICDGYLK